MSIITTNGCEEAKAEFSTNLGTFTNVGARTGYAVQLTASTAASLTTPWPSSAAPGKLIMGFAWRHAAASSASTIIEFVSQADGRNLFSLNWSETGVVTAFRRTSVSQQAVIGVATAVIPPDTWSYIEIEMALLAGTVAQRVIIRIDGNVVIDTNDTFAWWSSNPTFLRWLGGGGGTTMIDDVYLLDSVDATATHGRPFNSFLGPVRIESLAPSGNGASSQWVGSDGNSVDNYALVDEAPTNTADYVETTVVGNRDLYAMADLSLAAASVLAVEVVGVAVAPDGGAPKIKTVARLADGTTDVGPGMVPGTVWGSVRDRHRGLAPDGTVWTVAKLNAAQFGFELA